MSDTFRETTHKTWFSRIGGSFAGALVGLVLVALCVIGLFWNEGRAVTTARSLAEGAGAVVAVPSDSVDAANEGRLVHASGMLASDAVPADPVFGVTAPGVRLERKVEMFQWRESSQSESKKNLGGSEDTTTTYTYAKEWDDEPVDSSEFRQASGHENPAMDMRGESFQVPEAHLGAFVLNKTALDALDGEKRLAMTPDRLEAVRAAYGRSGDVTISEGRIYLGKNPSSPVIGDYRIGYDVVPLETVSVIARQSGSALEEYPTVAGDRLLLTATGHVPADKMFSDAATANTVMTWIFRAIGLVVLGIAFALILAPLGVLADVVPFFGSVVRLGTGTVALLLTVAVGSLTIALAWFWYRPLIALAIIVAGALVTFGLGWLRAKAQPAAKSAGSPAAA